MEIKFTLAQGGAMLNKEWGVELRKAYSAATKSTDAAKRPLRFPSGIELDGDHQCVHMKLLDRAPAQKHGAVKDTGTIALWELPDYFRFGDAFAVLLNSSARAIQ